MCFYLNGDLELPDAGFVIQPHLPWIVMTIDGLISDALNDNDAVGILRIACLRSLRILCLRSLQNANIEDILSDLNFFINESKGVLVLKKIVMKDISQIVNYKWVFVKQVFATLLFLFLSV